MRTFSFKNYLTYMQKRVNLAGLQLLYLEKLAYKSDHWPESETLIRKLALNDSSRSPYLFYLHKQCGLC